MSDYGSWRRRRRLVSMIAAPVVVLIATYLGVSFCHLSLSPAGCGQASRGGYLLVVALGAPIAAMVGWNIGDDLW